MCLAKAGSDGYEGYCRRVLEVVIVLVFTAMEGH